MSGFTTEPNCDTRLIADADLSRRSFLGASGTLMAGAAIGSLLARPALAAPGSGTLLPVRPIAGAGADEKPWGVALVYGEGKLDLIDLDAHEILQSFDGLRATHAITPVEALNRFVIHGHRADSRQGALLVIEADPVRKTWQVLLNAELPGGPALHWQPNPEHTEIMFNTVGDGSLHVLDTRTLELRRFAGGGGHSNMAFHENLLVATDEMAGPSNLNIVDRTTGKILSSTPVGHWGHGVTVNRERGMAYVWASEGVHVVSLAKGTMGKHLGTMVPPDNDERCWFCWTPQGGQFTHDVSWNPGDVYNPYLLVTDTKNHRFERIETGDPRLQPSYLQVSPGGKWGLCSLRGREEIGIVDTVRNEFKGTVKAGPARASFFERDMAFCRDRDFALVTNNAENTISLLDLSRRAEVRRITLPRRPTWLKALSPA